MKIDPKYRKWLLTSLRIVIPMILLWIIFRNIDFNALIEAFRGVNIALLMLSVLFACILQVLGGAYRWYKLVGINKRDGSLLKFIMIYWMAMFYGYFLPSNIGMDVYRVAAAGKIRKNFEQHTVVLLGEKFYTLVFSTVVLFASYLFVYPQITGSEVARTLDFLAILFILSVMLAIVSYIFLKPQFLNALAWTKDRLKQLAGSFAAKFSSRISFSMDQFIQEIPVVARKEFFTISLVLTVLLKISLAIGGYFLFLSLGYNLGFWAVLFANSVFFVLFLLPISFGSLGIREGAYIVVYNLFGVPVEVALVASFLALAGLLFTISIGGVISMSRNLVKTTV